MKPQRFQIICSAERFKELFSAPGIFKGFFSRKDFQVLYGDVRQIEGIELPDNFPEGEKFFKDLYRIAEEFIIKFPDCCEHHKKLTGNLWFKKSDYEELPIKVCKQLYYTLSFLEEREKDEGWVKDVTDYIEHNILSFGQLPEGYGSPVGLHFYENNLKKWLEWTDKISTELKQHVLQFLEDQAKPKDEKEEEETDLNLLFDTYKKWLSVFPFEIEYFKELKTQFAKSFPMFVGPMEYNRFIGVAKGKTHSIESLIESLLKITNHLLQQVKSEELVKRGLIADVESHQFDLANEAHRLKQTTLLEEFSETEKKYVDLLSNWLQNEKDYFKEIEPFIKVKKTYSEKTKTEKISEAINKFGFSELPMVKKLTQSQVKALYDLLGQKDLPYQIAMLNFLGFIDYVLNNHFKSKFEMYGQLGKWLNSGNNIRAVKGNLSTLSLKSREDKTKYTAHLHKETVKNDYQNLK
ncbi:MAG: hypothetical protein JNL65_11715 [Saprospiraceae bacterium]|nr:hypothetical protein [Saprospiraceae bacterium]